MTEKGKKMYNTANNAMNYTNKIINKLMQKIKLGYVKDGVYKLLITDKDLAYDFDALTVSKNIFKRNKMDLCLKKYKIRQNLEHAYIFEVKIQN